MSDDRRVGEKVVERYDGEDEGLTEYELDTEEIEDLESAMQDALAAVEKDGPVEGAGADGTPSAPAEPAAAASAGQPSVGRVSEAEAELLELRERAVRTLAEFENYRKRVNRERLEERRFRGKEVLQDLLAVVDNLERAVAAQGSKEDLQTGVELIVKQLHELLKSHDVERIDAMDERFDPQVHDAVSREESSEVERPTVSEVLISGYRLHERLLRPAAVKVKMPAPESGGEDDDS